MLALFNLNDNNLSCARRVLDIFYKNLLIFFLDATLTSFFPENYEDMVCKYVQGLN